MCQHMSKVLQVRGKKWSRVFLKGEELDQGRAWESSQQIKCISGQADVMDCYEERTRRVNTTHKWKVMGDEEIKSGASGGGRKWLC